MFGQVEGGVPGAAAGDEGPEPVPEGLAAAEAVVVDHRQVFEPRRDQPLAFVLGIAGRIGKRFVLAADFGQVIGRHGVHGMDG